MRFVLAVLLSVFCTSSAFAADGRGWTERMNPGPGYMPNTGGKHGRAIYHPPSKSMVFGGGDWLTSQPQYSGPYHNGTGSEIWSLDVLSNTWTLIRPFCVPGAVQPGRPDTVGFAYDSKRDRIINTPGFYFITQGFDPVAQPLGASNCGAVEGWGSYAFDMKTKTWIGPDAMGWFYRGAVRTEVTTPNTAVGVPSPPGGWGGDTGASFSVYNPTTDELLRTYGGTMFQRLNLTTGVWSQINLTNGDPNWNPIANRSQHVLDVAKQVLYWTDTQSRALVKVQLSNNAVTMIPLPAQYVAPNGDQDVYLVFDPVRRELFVPSTTNHGLTPPVGIGLYKVDTGVWTWEAVPTMVSGSVWGFDEATNSVIGIGKRTPGGTVSAYYLYGTSGPTPAPAIPTNLRVQ